MMKCGFSVRDAVEKRYSVRTYDPRPMEPEIREKILAYAENLQSPLGPKGRVCVIEKQTAANGEKLGTYGIIKGANLYLGAAIPDEPGAQEALGYDFEQLVLYAASLGFGTCWLGGTFNRGAFAAQMDLKAGELFPIISPIGYPAAKKRLSEEIFRRSLKADKRKDWKELFFENTFGNPLNNAGDYEFPLEMLRLAPSATNTQPWRVVRKDGAFHFFQAASMGMSVDMHRIDMGIAICHFHLAALEQGLEGRFEKVDHGVTLPEKAAYLISWIPA